MFLYSEKDGFVTREYAIQTIGESFQTQKALLEVVGTKEFGNALFLDGELQMTEKDEYIYHEMLVHPAMSSAKGSVSVCILGGGDGCAAREALKWTNVTSVDIYDWDKDLLQLFQHKYSFWNSQSLTHGKVSIHIENVLNVHISDYDFIFVDLVDPDYEDLQSRALWQQLIPKLGTLRGSSTLVLNVGGIYPWDDKNTTWILMLLADAFYTNETHTIETYKVFVPSFAREWCFFLIKPIEATVKTSLFENVPSIRYFDKEAWKAATTWTKNMSPMIPVKPVNLNRYLPPL